MINSPLKKRNRWKTVFRAVGFGAITLLSLIALGLAWISHSGRKEWAQAKAGLLAKGEKLSLQELASSPIPDELNFFADDLWTGPGPKGPKRPLTQDEIHFIESEHPQFSHLLASYKDQVALALKIWLESRKATPSQKREAAQIILRLLAPEKPHLNRIDALLLRPGAQRPTLMNSEMLLGMSSFFTDFLSISQYYYLEGQANLELGNTPAASTNVAALLTLAKTLAPDPMLITFLVRNSIEQQAVNLIDAGIKQHKWSKEDLLRFEDQLHKISLPQALANTLRNERGMFNESFQGIAEGQVPPGWAANPELKQQMSWLRGYIATFGGSDQACFNNSSQILINHLEAADHSGFSSRSLPPIFSPSPRATLWPAQLFSRLSATAITSTLSRTFLAQAQINQTATASALERYRLIHGEYPAALDKMVPEILLNLPADPMTGNPLSYRRLTPETFLLWSVGWNETDDGGQPGKNRHEGDWVWGEKIR